MGRVAKWLRPFRNTFREEDGEMVAFNTGCVASSKVSYEFMYLIDIPHRNCIFGSAKESNTGKLMFFFIFSQLGKIYRRDGLKGIWIEVDNCTEEYFIVRAQFIQALANNQIACYTNFLEDRLC